MEPWWKVVEFRKEVREGRSFNPDEFAIALEQVVAGTAPVDYRDPRQFFERTVFTRALTVLAGIVLRRLAGQTADSPPVLTLITQFGGGKTHALTALYHLAKLGEQAVDLRGIAALLAEARLAAVPQAKVAVFVGNAWDPREGRETPWIDIARQIAGAEGVAALGKAAETTPPGTEALGRVFEVAGGPVLILCDEVLNFVNRHRVMAEPFHAFIQNLAVAATGNPRIAVVFSLPRSQVEMTEWDLQWQERITKVVNRVARELIANDEAEISEVIRRRLFEDLGNDTERRAAATAYADWCFDRRAQLPPEWTSIDTAGTDKKARELLRDRFERCYPFHPATLSVFQRKWQALPQYQQTRGTLAMLAQWVALAAHEGFTKARTEPLLTLGSAPLDEPAFRSVVLGQLGEARLMAAIETDIAGPQSHARALDADSKAQLRDIHRRVATVILFESSGGQSDKVAHLPELRFALGEPGIDTTSIDTAANALDTRSFFIRKVGADGFRIGFKPKLNKVVSDRRASLDEETEVRPEVRRLVKREFERGATLQLVSFPADSTDIPDSPRLMLVTANPEWEWSAKSDLRARVAEWTRQRGVGNRLYPGAVVWCIRRPGRELREKVELALAWRRVQREVVAGTLGSEFDTADLADIKAKTIEAEDAAKEEVWAEYRYVILADSNEPDGLKVIDLGAGHSSSNETLCGRVVQALRQESLLSESVGAGYLDRNWPPALAESGTWPLSSLRQAFVNGVLTRLLDPDKVLRAKLVEFVEHGDLGLASGRHQDGTFDRIWFSETVAPEEVTFDANVFLLKKATAAQLKASPEVPQPEQADEGSQGPDAGGEAGDEKKPPEQQEHSEGRETTAVELRTLRLVGSITAEVWNRFGTRIIPKLRAGSDLKLVVDLSVTVGSQASQQMEKELQQAIDDVGLTDTIRIEDR